MARRRSAVWGAVGLAATLVVVAGSGVPARRDAAVGGPTAAARRGPLVATVALGGDVSCDRGMAVGVEVEQLSERTREVTILSLADEGSLVRKGDVVCRLDASGYLELVDVQRIEVEKAAAELRTAELDQGAARATLREFAEGLADQQVRDYQTKIGMAEADAARAADRAEWSRGMLTRGYISVAELAEERRSVMKNQLDLEGARRGQDVFRRFTAPKNERDMESRIAAAEEKRAMADLGHRTQIQRLAHYQKQVELCTIRAPHDGLVVYDDGWWSDDVQVRVGAKVFLGKALINLPDLAHLTVRASLHESFRDRVQVGMPATIVVPAVPGHTYRGHVSKINQIPWRNYFVGIDHMRFIATIAFDEPPGDILPEMSAEVRVERARKPDALVVPGAAIRAAGHRTTVVVVTPAGDVVREVTMGLTDGDDVEIVAGLAEGEVVRLTP